MAKPVEAVFVYAEFAAEITGMESTREARMGRCVRHIETSAFGQRN